MMKIGALCSRLGQDRSGTSMIEFALALPFLMTVGLWGAEIASLTIAHMRVSRIAEHLADHASRIGDTSTLENRKIYESDINDLLFGSDIQGGGKLDFYEHGRAIISSLEVTEDTKRQYIHWQRCKGKLRWNSTYGDEGDGTDGSLPGMGPKGEEIKALPGEAVMFVEVAYEYQPLVSARFVPSKTITNTSAFTVRVSRDLSQIYQSNVASPSPQATCNKFDGFD